MKTLLLFSILAALSLTSCSNWENTAQVKTKEIPGLFAGEEYHYVPKDIYVPLFRDPFWFLKPNQRIWHDNNQ